MFWESMAGIRRGELALPWGAGEARLNIINKYTAGGGPGQSCLPKLKKHQITANIVLHTDMETSNLYLITQLLRGGAAR